MLVATAGWTQGCHYVMLNREVSSDDVVVELRLPHGSTKEQRLGSLEAAKKWLQREVESVCLMRNES